MFTFVFTNWTALLGARVITLLLNVLPQSGIPTHGGASISVD